MNYHIDTNLPWVPYSPTYDPNYSPIGYSIINSHGVVMVSPQENNKQGFNKYEITYIINNIKYKLIVKVKNGPCKYLLVLNENDEDVTNMIKPYLGPSNDFHKQVYTPISLGHKELCCLTLDGQEVNFRGYDNLV